MPDSEVKNLYVGGNYIGGNLAGRDMIVDTMGDKTMTTINQNNSGTVYGSMVAAEKIENSFNGLQESKADDGVKQLLEELLNEIKVLNTKVPASQAQAVENMAKRADVLIGESKSETPDKEWYQLSLKGIKDAALSVGEAAKPILEIAAKLGPLLI